MTDLFTFLLLARSELWIFFWVTYLVSLQRVSSTCAHTVGKLRLKKLNGNKLRIQRHSQFSPGVNGVTPGTNSEQVETFKKCLKNCQECHAKTRVSKKFSWRFWEIQDGCQDGCRLEIFSYNRLKNTIKMQTISLHELTSNNILKI